MHESVISLSIAFTATADTPRLRAIDLAERIRNYIAVEMEAAGVCVEIQGAALYYEVPYGTAGFEQDRRN